MLTAALLVFGGLYHVLALPTLTITLSYTKSAEELCTTNSGLAPVPTVPTQSFDVWLPPHIALAITDSTPIATITPAPTTTTETTNSITEVTETLSTKTGTFYSTSTVFSTTTETTTTTSTLTGTNIAETNVTETSTIPTPTGFVPITESVGDTNYTGDAVDEALDGSQRRLELRDESGTPARTDANVLLWPSWYPNLVVCNNYTQASWTELLAIVHHTSTVTDPAPTTTSTTIVVVTSTSTLAPSVETTLTSTTTLATTETAAKTEWDATIVTETQTATQTSTVHAACATSNLLGPRVSNGDWLQLFNIPVGSKAPDLVRTTAFSAYECCVECAEFTPGCQLGAYVPDQVLCAMIADPNVCPAGEVKASLNQKSFNTMPQIQFNGPCGMMGKSDR